MLNKWKGECRHHPIRGRSWCRCARKNYGRFGDYFTTHNVSLMFCSYRDGVQHHGESDDQVQETPSVFMSREPYRCDTHIGTTICNL